MTGHIRIVNDPVELVPLLITFNDSKYKQIYELLNKTWLSEEELAQQLHHQGVGECIQLLKKGNLIEEQWRMPAPGQKPVREYRATYSKFRANFQCNMSDLSDLLYLSISNDETLRAVIEQVEGEIEQGQGNVSINDLARKLDVSPMFIRGLAKRSHKMDVKGQGLVLLDGTR